MKKVILIFYSCLVTHSALCQWVGTNPIYFTGGNVGIGVDNPGKTLDVNGVARFRRLNDETAGIIIDNGAAITMRGWTGFNPYIEWRISNGTRQGYMGWNSDRLSLVLENSFNYTIEGGKVGIGTPSPVGKLEINHAGGQLRLSGGTVAGGVWTDNADRLYLADWNTGGKGLNINMTTGTVYVGTETSSVSGYGSQLSMLGASANGDHLYIARYNVADNQSEMRVNIGDDVGQAEDKFVVGTHSWNGGAWHSHLTVQANGRVGIGTSTPDESLAVKGKIHTSEVRVDITPGITVPDYVFEKNYNLMSLSEVENYINANKHLPEVPSAKEMEAEGMNLKEMNLILLKKVEELTLHLIEMKKEIEIQRELNIQQQRQIENLKSK